ncbi:MAG: bifunctional DNA-formamidopyrimidine glycosylase/DNA-(apurinic or apyrimidinic site) lyase [Alphaproteobacteria bacterium]|nr:bifunctional DNA-formamidopyrimidine glycosylase/DNA-(apurinic or apyrimidinic site) lyase [Alphaproteobacteria bacterium]
MPELPEVETVARGLARVWEGRRFARVEARRPDLRRPLPQDLGQRLTGARIERVGRRAKYGLVDTDRGDTLIFHLGMSGRMRLDPTEIETHDHILFTTDEGRVVAFNDARRFGSLDLTETAALDAHPLLAGIGPEPLGPGLTEAHLAEAFADRIAPVKALLLDQRLVAGLGNIYVCEALHISGIHPERPGGKVKRAEIAKLVPAIREVLTQAIEAGGSTLRDYAQVDGELGYFQKQWRVYGREDEGCPACAKPVQRIVQSGRSSFFCKRCQK